MAERTEDELRTRAREAAGERVRKSGYPLDGPIANLMHVPAAIDSFTEGALWHAAQQPTRELAAHDREVKAAALRDFADSTRFPSHWILFRRHDGSGVTVSDLLRETAARIESGSQS